MNDERIPQEIQDIVRKVKSDPRLATSQKIQHLAEELLRYGRDLRAHADAKNKTPNGSAVRISEVQLSTAITASDEDGGGRIFHV